MPNFYQQPNEIGGAFKALGDAMFPDPAKVQHANYYRAEIDKANSETALHNQKFKNLGDYVQAWADPAHNMNRIMATGTAAEPSLAANLTEALGRTVLLQGGTTDGSAPTEDNVSRLLNIMGMHAQDTFTGQGRDLAQKTQANELDNETKIKQTQLDVAGRITQTRLEQVGMSTRQAVGFAHDDMVNRNKDLIVGQDQTAFVSPDRARALHIDPVVAGQMSVKANETLMPVPGVDVTGRTQVTGPTTATTSAEYGKSLQGKLRAEMNTVADAVRHGLPVSPDDYARYEQAYTTLYKGGIKITNPDGTISQMVDTPGATALRPETVVENVHPTAPSVLGAAGAGGPAAGVTIRPPVAGPVDGAVNVAPVALGPADVVPPAPAGGPGVLPPSALPPASLTPSGPSSPVPGAAPAPRDMVSMLGLDPTSTPEKVATATGGLQNSAQAASQAQAAAILMAPAGVGPGSATPPGTPPAPEMAPAPQAQPQISATPGPTAPPSGAPAAPEPPPGAGQAGAAPAPPAGVVEPGPAPGAAPFDPNALPPPPPGSAGFGKPRAALVIPPGGTPEKTLVSDRSVFGLPQHTLTFGYFSGLMNTGGQALFKSMGYDPVTGVLGKGYRPGLRSAAGNIVAEGMPGMGGVYAEGLLKAPEDKQFDLAARQFIEPLLRIATGAAAPEQEVARYLRYLPVSTDDEGTIKAKLDGLNSMLKTVTVLSAISGLPVEKMFGLVQSDPAKVDAARMAAVKQFPELDAYLPQFSAGPKKGQTMSAPDVLGPAGAPAGGTADPSVDDIITASRARRAKAGAP